MNKNDLIKLVDKLNDNDHHIIRQITAIIYRYLEKRGRI